MQPFSRRAFLQALATITGTVALPVDLASAPLDLAADVGPIGTTGGGFTPTLFEVAVRQTFINVDSALYGAIQIPGLPDVTVTMRTRSDVRPSLGQRMTIDEVIAGHRLRAEVYITEVHYDGVTDESTITGACMGSVAIDRLTPAAAPR